MKNLKGYVTVKDAATILGVSVMTLHRWDAKGKFKPIRHPINGYRLYKESDLNEILRAINSGANLKGVWANICESCKHDQKIIKKKLDG